MPSSFLEGFLEDWRDELMRDKQNILRTAEKYVVEQKFAAAIGEYRKLLELETGEPSLLNIVGDLLVRQGKPQETLKNFQEVVEIFMARGSVSQAIAMLKKILSIASQDVHARESLADLYEKQGFRFDAVREFNSLVDHYVEAQDIDLLQAIHECDSTYRDVNEKLSHFRSRLHG